MLPQVREFLKKHETPLDWLWFIMLVAGLCWVMLLGTEMLGYNWQFYRVGRYYDRLLQGLAVTLEISLVSMLLAFFFGFLVAFMRLSSSPVARLLARIYLEMIRNTPLLIQIFLLYFVVAPIFDWGGFTTAVLALSLFEGAYISEIVRGGIMAVSHGQWEAALSLGMFKTQVYQHVVLPQMLRQSLPALTSQAVSLIKDSALVSTIAIYDLTMQGQSIVAETFLTFEIWFTVAGIYLLLTGSLSIVVYILEKRIRAVYA